MCGKELKVVLAYGAIPNGLALVQYASMTRLTLGFGEITPSANAIHRRLA